MKLLTVVAPWSIVLIILQNSKSAFVIAVEPAATMVLFVLWAGSSLLRSPLPSRSPKERHDAGQNKSSLDNFRSLGFRIVFADLEYSTRLVVKKSILEPAASRGL